MKIFSSVRYIPAADSNKASNFSVMRLKFKKGEIFGFLIVFFLIFCAFSAKWIAPHNPFEQNLSNRLHSPDAQHWMGTDELGRDVLSRIIYGSRISLTVGAAAVAFALILGVEIGLVAGFYGGVLDHSLMGLVEILMAFPNILLAIAIVAVLGPNLVNATLAIGIVSIPFFARLTRAQVLSIKEADYVQAARAIGCPDWRILYVHVLPNCAGALVVQAALCIGSAILDLAGLSFLGLGAQPPLPEWGSMLSDTVHFLEKAPWTVIFPGIIITISVWAFNLIGDGLRNKLDPRSQTR